MTPPARDTSIKDVSSNSACSSSDDKDAKVHPWRRIPQAGSNSGVVKFYDAKKGFGYITRDNGDSDLFVGSRCIKRHPAVLVAGEEVIFQVGWNEVKRKEYAFEVKAI